LFIIIKFYVNVIISYHTIAVRSSKLLFFYFILGVNGLAGVGCYLHPGS